jgi:hypothetical protein
MGCRARCRRGAIRFHALAVRLVSPRSIFLKNIRGELKTITPTIMGKMITPMNREIVIFGFH